MHWRARPLDQTKEVLRGFSPALRIQSPADWCMLGGIACIGKLRIGWSGTVVAGIPHAGSRTRATCAEFTGLLHDG